jgi:superfamily I DNA/RNA helicase
VPPASLEERPAFIRAVQAVLAATKANTKVIDFDDMVWLPAALDLKVPQYDFVLIDETQDLNAAQIALVLKAVKKAPKKGGGGGRVVAVGDPRQAIYGFRGAADGAFDQVREALGATVLPLSVTYRCARAIVREAARYVQHLEAAPDAIEGRVSDVEWAQMMRSAEPGDFILSRTNAPLLGICLNFLKEGRKASIQGRDIGTKLAGLIKRSGAQDVNKMLSWVNDWSNNEVKRLALRDKDATAVLDQKECIEALCEGETQCWAVIQKIERLFADGNEKSRITLSTTHKAKGMERDRVWLLRGTYFLKTAKTEQQKLEETNLFYVALTRARETVFMVESRPR